MNARPLAVVVERNSQADHRFPSWIARTLEHLGWQVAWIPAGLTRLQFSRALEELREISRTPVFWTVNYRDQLTRWTNEEGLTCICWNEVFPMAYEKVTSMPASEHFWIFCGSDRLIEKHRSLGVQAYFNPLGFDPGIFYPKKERLRYDLSFVGSGLAHMEANFSRCIGLVCDGIDAPNTSPEKKAFLGAVAGFLQLFSQMEWTDLEKYRGEVVPLIEAYCAGLALPKDTVEAARNWLIEQKGIFSGQLGRFQRAASVRAASKFPRFALFGRGWEGLGLEEWLRNPVRYNDTANVFRQSRINLHLHRLYMDGVNDRMINVPACDALLLARSTPQICRMLNEGEHFVGFQTVAEMKDKIKWLLEDEASRLKIAKEGSRYVHANYTMEAQVRKILKIVGLPNPSEEKVRKIKDSPKAQSSTECKRVRIAVVGHGSMGRHHARVIDQIQGATLVSISDTRPELLDGLGRKYDCETYTSYEEMFDREDIDAVCIAVPTSLHQEVTRAALSRGIHVLVEKPIAGSVQDALEIEALAAQSNAKLMVGHIERFNPALRELKSRLDKGELGEIFQLEASRQGPFPARIMDVGVAVDLAVHDIDIIRYLSGQEARQVFAHAQNRLHGPHEDAIHGIMKMSGGVVANLSVNWVTPTKSRKLSVLGEAGMFVVDYIAQDLFFYENGESQQEPWHAVALMRGVGEGQMIRPFIPKSEPLRNEIEHFVECIQEDREPITTANDGLRALTIAEALLESSRLGTSLDLEATNTGSHLCVAA